MNDEIIVFATEAELVAAFCAWSALQKTVWTPYHETAGWDLLLVHPIHGTQIGIEAKLSLNAKVIAQALPSTCSWSELTGPDYRAVLVPEKGCQNHMRPICDHLGLTVLSIHGTRSEWRKAGEIEWRCSPWDLPNEASTYERGWHSWLPGARCPLPDYVPDVTGGHAAPVMLTPWKVRAIKLMILLERTGLVTRRDMKALELSPTRFTDSFNGFLAADLARGGYVRSDRTPDLRAQHPVNYAEIEADFDSWAPAVRGLTL